jgi:drug/metabolite transporter (DMT)-like permease
VAALLFGMLVLGELPDPWTFVGTALIVLAGLYVVRFASDKLRLGPRDGRTR